MHIIWVIGENANRVKKKKACREKVVTVDSLIVRKWWSTGTIATPLVTKVTERIPSFTMMKAAKDRRYEPEQTPPRKRPRSRFDRPRDSATATFFVRSKIVKASQSIRQFDMGMSALSIDVMRCINLFPFWLTAERTPQQVLYDNNCKSTGESCHHDGQSGSGQPPARPIGTSLDPRKAQFTSSPSPSPCENGGNQSGSQSARIAFSSQQSVRTP